MEERNHCIEAPAWCVTTLNDTFGLEGWINLIGLVGRAFIFMGGL